MSLPFLLSNKKHRVIAENFDHNLPADEDIGLERLFRDRVDVNLRCTLAHLADDSALVRRIDHRLHPVWS